MNAPGWSRRDLLRTLLASSIPPAILPLHATEAPAASHSRRYRVDATILLLSAPILTRTGVGGAYVATRNRVRPERTTRVLEFAAGSWSERAHGVHRMGLFHEVQDRRAGESARAAFFGFMTSSPEKDIGEARRSMRTGAGGHYVAVIGNGSRGCFRCRRTDVDLPAGQKWEECPKISLDMRRRLDDPACTASDIETGEPEPYTFLDSVRRAMATPGTSQDTVFVHNAKRYRLTARRQPDSDAATKYAAKGLAAPGARIERLRASILDVAAGGRTPFQVWFDPAEPTGLPIAFEFQPRSFLRLVFEWDRSATGPVQSLNSLFETEEA